jgi:hypothetical protein
MNAGSSNNARVLYPINIVFDLSLEAQERSGIPGKIDAFFYVKEDYRGDRKFKGRDRSVQVNGSLPMSRH